MLAAKRRTRRSDGKGAPDSMPCWGGRAVDGQYARLEAHGFYWTASESDVATAWFYNFGKGGSALNRHGDGEKVRAFSVRCIRE